MIEGHFANEAFTFFEVECYEGRLFLIIHHMHVPVYLTDIIIVKTLLHISERWGSLKLILFFSLLLFTRA